MVDDQLQHRAQHRWSDRQQTSHPSLWRSWRVGRSGSKSIKSLPIADNHERSRRARALELLDRVGLGEYGARYPNGLSGGQQQRVALARALAMEPAVMLFDEPLSALDPELVGEVLDVTMEVARGGMTMLVVTHEIGFARRAADRVIVMDDGAIIEESTAAAVLDNPQNERTRRFLSKVER